MYGFLMFIHVVACALLVLVVLLQAGRGAGLNVFGGGGADALFSGPTSTNFMKQLTMGLAITFAATSLLLTLIGGRPGMRSVTSEVPYAPPAASQPAVPAPAGASSPASPAPAAAPVKK